MPMLSIKIWRTSAIFAALLAVASCGSYDDSDGVGGVTASEAQALNEAAAMLDARSENAQSALTHNSSR